MNDTKNDNQVWPGLDALRANFAPQELEWLRGKRLGLLTNQTGLALDGTPTLEVLRELGLDVRALFSPEHGPQGTREGDIESGEQNGLPVWSLYGATRRPTPAMLAGLDALVCDLQDVGARFYTYASTLAHCMDECAPLGLPILVLDRPNPLGNVVEGPMIEAGERSFIGYLDVPVRHGQTLGELARFYRKQVALSVEIRVVAVQNARPEALWPALNLPWRRPSPNLPDFPSAAWYPGLCLLEFSGVCVGRGTNGPFQILAAPTLQPEKLLEFLPDWPEIAEIRAETCEVVPSHAIFAGETCSALRFSVPGTGFPQYPVLFGLAVLGAMRHSGQLTDVMWEKSRPLVGSWVMLEVLNRADWAMARHLWALK